MNEASLIQAAMAQQGGQTNYIPGSPMANPSMGPTAPPQGPSVPPMGPMTAPPMPPMIPPMEQGAPMPKSQEEIIVSALIKQLERIDKQKQMGVV